MSQKSFRLPILTVVLLLLAGGSHAQQYDLGWFSIDGGGATFSLSADGIYKLGGTIGQPDAFGPLHSTEEVP